MSLINQMLRDLEQRNKQKPNSAPTLDVKIAVRPTGGKLSRLWLLSIMALPLAYLWFQKPPAQQATAPVSAKVISEPKQAVMTTSAEPPADQTRSQSLASAQLSERIVPSSLPAIATPPETNSPSAEPQKPAVSQFKVDEPVKLASKAQTTAPQTTEIPAPAERSRSQTPASMPTERPKTAKISTPHEQAEELYRQAQRSASTLMSKENLKEALQLDPHYLPARTLLLQTLVKSHADAELSDFVDESLQLFPSNLLFIKTRAHLYVQHKNFAAAVNILERINADTVDDSTYLALLAAGYQNLQRFPQAGRIYRQLTQIQPDKAENWLGLAIAQDKLNQTQAAAQSYRQALDKKTLNTEVVNYINQRLSALNQ